MIARLVALTLVWLALTAATPLPLTPPPPDVAAIIPFASAPLDKPARADLADPLFRQVAAEPRQPLAVWAQSGSGWTALQLGDAARARDIFARLSGAPTPAPLDGWSRHGLGLALYALGRFEEAERVWTDLLVRTVPAPIARDVAFWHGETFGRIGRYHDAE